MTLAEKFGPVGDLRVRQHVDHWRGQLDVGHNHDPNSCLFDVLKGHNNSNVNTSLHLVLVKTVTCYIKLQSSLVITQTLIFWRHGDGNSCLSEGITPVFICRCYDLIYFLTSACFV